MGERGPQPGEGGAPRKVIDLDVVRRAAGLGCTTSEIATLVGVGRATFFDHLKVDEDLKNAIDEGRARGCITLRRMQWQQAELGNPTMLIWLGKQLLGQRDKHEVEQTGVQTIQMQHLLAARAFSETLNGGQPGLEGHDSLEAPEIEGEVEPAELRDLMQPALE
jgi:hypothetical protein